MSFFAELKRRNVVRVGIAYIVLSWLVLQVVDVVLNNMAAPDWLFGAVLLLLAVGFPFVLVFSWAFELTPEGLKRDSDVHRGSAMAQRPNRRFDWIIIVLLAIAVLIYAYDKIG